MVAVSSSRGGLVRQNTFTKESRAPAAGAVRPATTQESAARLVTSAERESGRAVAVSAAAWAQDRVSLVGGRIVRRRSAGVAAAGAGPSQEPSGAPSLVPTPSCAVYDGRQNRWMERNTMDCATNVTEDIENKCKKSNSRLSRLK